MKDLNVMQMRDSICKELENQQYAEGTIKTYLMIYNGLIRYMSDHQYTELNEKMCLDYVEYRTGYKKDGFYGKGNIKLNQVMKPLEVLLYYKEHGSVKYQIRSKLAPYHCPEQFQESYFLIQEEFEERHYAPATIKSNINQLRRYLVFLDEEDVDNYNDITANHLSKFLEKFKQCKPKYIATIVYVLRNYHTFLYSSGFTTENKSRYLPKIRMLRNAFIPYTWKREDVIKLLDIVDRADPKGKRDYAIFLIVIRLGLRVSDIRNMRLTNLLWKRKLIILEMAKTKKKIELPLLDDIGWAIIDYLQNGRPKSNCDRVFIRHRAPHGPVGENESFYRELHRYMTVAGITAPLDSHCGLHSLRNTLASNMLKAKTPLPIISETLGHRSIHTTSIYLKIDLDGLRMCALDPEEVFQA
jgi:site-specific recombinase XerD